MQNRYAGDVGDFSKFGLLRQIGIKGLVVGVNWYLVADEAHNNDGKHIGFLTDKRYDDCDDELRDSLHSVVKHERSVFMLEKQQLIHNAVYFSEQLYPPMTNDFSRNDWHKQAMKRFSSANIVFLDPDNGILVKSTSMKSAKSIKFVLRDEICDYYATGHSVVIYNHRCRQVEAEYLRRFDWMSDESRLESAHILGLKFVRGSVRDYIFAVQPMHLSLVSSAMEAIMDSSWSRHFVRLNMSL